MNLLMNLLMNLDRFDKPFDKTFHEPLDEPVHESLDKRFGKLPKDVSQHLQVFYIVSRKYQQYLINPYVAIHEFL